MNVVNFLGSPPGKLIMLNAVLAAGMIAHQHGIDYAEHLTIAALCSELVFLASEAVLKVGTRLAALAGLLATGLLGSMYGMKSGELVVVATMVVIGEIIQS